MSYWRCGDCGTIIEIRKTVTLGYDFTGAPIQMVQVTDASCPGCYSSNLSRCEMPRKEAP
jgi:hypothetical protein